MRDQEFALIAQQKIEMVSARLLEDMGVEKRVGDNETTKPYDSKEPFVERAKSEQITLLDTIIKIDEITGKGRTNFVPLDMASGRTAGISLGEAEEQLKEALKSPAGLFWIPRLMRGALHLQQGNFKAASEDFRALYDDKDAAVAPAVLAMYAQHPTLWEKCVWPVINDIPFDTLKEKPVHAVHGFAKVMRAFGQKIPELPVGKTAAFLQAVSEQMVALDRTVPKIIVETTVVESILSPSPTPQKKGSFLERSKEAIKNRFKNESRQGSEATSSRSSDSGISVGQAQEVSLLKSASSLDLLVPKLSTPQRKTSSLFGLRKVNGLFASKETGKITASKSATDLGELAAETQDIKLRQHSVPSLRDGLNAPPTTPNMSEGSCSNDSGSIEETPSRPSSKETSPRKSGPQIGSSRRGSSRRDRTDGVPPVPEEVIKKILASPALSYTDSVTSPEDEGKGSPGK